MRAEADQADRHQHGQSRERAQRRSQALACTIGREHQEWQREPAAQLDPDPGRQRERGRTEAR